MSFNNEDPPTIDLSAEHDSFVGTVFADRYEIDSIIGKGGMSVVYKAMHRLMKKVVAVKMLHPQMLLSPTNLKRFQQEAQAASSLSHKNVITVYDLGVTPGGVPYIVMEYIQGAGLSELIKAEGRIKPERCLEIFLQACDGLAAAHEKGIVHRDIKPSNVMIIPASDGKGLVKIVDFGVAKLLPTEGEEAQRLTQTGEMIGSPVYMSPEQWLAQPQDARSDIYSIGCLMYEALTGEPPLVGASLYETMYKHLNEVPQGLGEAVPDAQLREQLEAILFKAMAKEPERRYQKMSELTSALDKVRAGTARGLLARLNSLWETSRLKRVPRRARSVLVIALATAVVVLLAWSGLATSALFRSPANPYVEMSWVKTPEPTPPRPRNFMQKQNVVQLMINLLGKRQGQESPALIERLVEYGRFRMQYHDWVGAAPRLERALWITRKSRSSEDLEFYRTQVDLADCYYELGRYQEAAQLYPGAIRHLHVATSDWELVKPMGKLGDIFLRLGNLTDAENYLSRSLEIWRGPQGEEQNIDATQDSGLTASRLADAYRLEGKLDQAEKTYTLAITVWKKLDGDGARKNLALCHYYLAEIQRLKGHEQEAAASYKEALDVAQSAFGPQHSYVANVLYRYSDVLWHQNRWFESLDKKAKANAMRRKF